MNILITGANGFIGSNLTKRLIQENHQLTITATSKTNFDVHKTLYPSFEGIDWKYTKNQDVIFHQMAINDTQNLDEEEMMRANVDGPIKLFNAALEGGCKKFIYASSTAIYGNSPAPYKEDTNPDPLTPYAKSKLIFDDFAQYFAKENKVLVVGLRYCNIYGPGEEHKGKMMSMVGQILRTMLKKKAPTLFKYGEQKRDWCYVKDIVDANLLALNAKESGIYNIGSGNSWTFNEIVQFVDKAICEKEGIKTKGDWNFAWLPEREWASPIYIECAFPESYQSYTECDITKAKNGFNYHPKYDLKTGIDDYLHTFL